MGTTDRRIGRNEQEENLVKSPLQTSSFEAFLNKKTFIFEKFYTRNNNNNRTPFLSPLFGRGFGGGHSIKI